MNESPLHRFRQIDAVFDAALDLPPAERAAFVDRMCADDPTIGADVHRLLVAHDHSGEFLGAPALELLEPVLRGTALFGGDVSSAPDRIGAFRIVRELGRGGMGVVYLGERDDGHFEQRVALKLIRPRGGAKHLVHRFIEERRILSLLQHAGIARLVDGGVTDEGLPYFAMEFVDGEPIDRYCDARQLTIAARIDLFTAVCDIVQYAHQHLVVHRDLKPSNILVTADGQLKLLDFGIAKLLDRLADGDEPLETHTALLAMTPEFAAPEQVRGEPVSTATDVYALGILLYLLLTGERPYDVRGLTPADVQRVICDVVPLKPSAAAARNDGRVEHADRAAARGESADRLCRRLRGDLDTIVMKALHKDPQRRYVSAAALHDDLQRFRDGRPVQARPDSAGYRLGRLVRRNRAAAAASLVMLISLLGATAFSTAQMREARLQRDSALLDVRRQEAMAEVQRIMASDSRGRGGAALSTRERIELAEEMLTQRFRAEPWLVVEVLGDLSDQLYEMGDRNAQRAMLARAASISRVSGLPLQLAFVDCRRAYSFAYDEQLDSARNELAEARSELARAARGSRLARVQAACLSAEGQVLVESGQSEAALPLLARAVALTDSAPGALWRLSILNDLATVLRAQGRTREAVVYQQRIVHELADAGYGNTDIMPNVVSFLTSSLFELGELAMVDSIVAAFVREQEARHGAGDAGSMFAFIYGLGKLRIGDLDSADIWIARAMYDTTAGAGGITAWAPPALTQLHLEQGRLDHARRSAAELAVNTPTRRATAVWLRARIRHAEGHPEAASVMLEDALLTMSGDGPAPPSFLAAPLVTAAEWRLLAGDGAAADSLAVLALTAAALDTLALERSAYAGRAELVRSRALLAMGDPAAAIHAADRARTALANGYGRGHAFAREAAALRDSLSVAYVRPRR